MVKTATNQNGDRSKRRHQNGDRTKEGQVKTATETFLWLKYWWNARWWYL